MALIHRNVKNTIIIIQCKTYLNTCLVLIIMLVRLLVEVDMFIVFPYYRLKKEKKYSLILSVTILIQCSAYTITLAKIIQYVDSCT